jgi:uncharacterized protein YukE
MANQFKVDTASLRAAGSQFATQSDALSRALGQLQSGLAGVSGAIGDDDQGHKFASQYNPSSAKIQQALGQMVAGLSKVGQAFPAMADNYDHADESIKVSKG